MISRFVFQPFCAPAFLRVHLLKQLGRVAFSLFFKARCKVYHIKINSHSFANNTDLHIKGFTLYLATKKKKKRQPATHKWPIWVAGKRTKSEGWGKEFFFSALLDILKILRIEFNGLALDETGLLYFYWCIFLLRWILLGHQVLLLKWPQFLNKLSINCSKYSVKSNFSRKHGNNILVFQEIMKLSPILAFKYLARNHFVFYDVIQLPNCYTLVTIATTRWRHKIQHGGA